MRLDEPCRQHIYRDSSYYDPRAGINRDRPANSRLDDGPHTRDAIRGEKGARDVGGPVCLLNASPNGWS